MVSKASLLTFDFSTLSLKVATFILQKILLDETGLGYICQTYERFSHVAMILVSNQCASHTLHFNVNVQSNCIKIAL